MIINRTAKEFWKRTDRAPLPTLEEQKRLDPRWQFHNAMQRLCDYKNKKGEK